jgi:hypothetical protein
MTKLTNPVAILSRTNGALRLTSIDTETQTCTIYNGTEKVIGWTTAAAYRLDNGAEKSKTLTPKLLTALHDAEIATQQPSAADDTSPAAEATQATVPQDEAAAPEDIVTPDDGETVPQAAQEAAAKASAKAHKGKKAKESKINETEKAMLATLPIMDGFKGTDSAVTGKDWLAKVEAKHNIPKSSTRALIVSLKKKEYISVKGRNSGQKVTTVQLAERGIKYLVDAGILTAETEKTPA